MKKLFTFLLIAGFAASAQAQVNDSRRVVLGGSKKDKQEKEAEKPIPQNPRDVVLGDVPGQGETFPSGSTREQQVNQINREYDAKVQSIRNNPTLTAEEKERIIRDLNKQREQKIRQVEKGDRNGKDRRDKDRDDDDYDDDRKSDKKDKKDKKYNNGNGRGKKLGWEKGVGNPHRSKS